MAATASEINAASVRTQWAVTDDLKDVAGSPAGQHTFATLNPVQSTYTLTSTPPGKYYSSDALALVAAAATIDLTALPGLQATIDGTGLKVQAFRITGRSGNGALTISEGAATPYELFGAANPIVYPAGCTKPWQFEFDDLLADISGTVKHIDLAGTGTEIFDIEFILG